MASRWLGFVPPEAVPGHIEPLFGSSCKPYTLLTCQDVHPHGPMPEGRPHVCMADKCHKSGLDHLASLQRDPLTDPKPEPKPPQLALPAPEEPAKKRSGKMMRRKAARRIRQMETAS